MGQADKDPASARQAASAPEPVKQREAQSGGERLNEDEAKPDDPIKDDPYAREKWFADWFGPIAHGYLSHRQSVAEREIQKWGSMIPGTPTRMRSKSAQADGAGMAEGVFRNIGPFHEVAQLQHNANDPNVIDTGRITVILPHPTNPRLLYVGYAGGGLWRCQNADVAANGD